MPTDPPFDPNYVSPEDLATWSAVDGKRIRREPVTPQEEAIWESVNKKLLAKAADLATVGGFLTPAQGKIVVAVGTILLTMIVGLMGWNTVVGPSNPVTVEVKHPEALAKDTPSPLPPVVPTDGFKLLAQAMESGLGKISQSVDTQTELMKKLTPEPEPIPKPKPTPTPDDPAAAIITYTVTDVESGKAITDGQIPLNKLVKITAKSPSAIVWTNATYKNFTFHSEGQTTTLMASADGEICIGGVCLSKGTISPYLYYRITAGQGPQPPPLPPFPPPDPKPNPNPTPVTQALWMVIIEETADATTNRSLLFKDLDIAKRMQDKGHRKRVLDKDSVDKDGKQPDWMKSYLKHAEGKTLPYVIITDLQGRKVIYEGPLPSTKAGVLTMLEKAGG
jgi:hypothetical protein